MNAVRNLINQWIEDLLNHFSRIRTLCQVRQRALPNAVAGAPSLAYWEEEVAFLDQGYTYLIEQLAAGDQFLRANISSVKERFQLE
jgi:hypothetical protein